MLIILYAGYLGPQPIRHNSILKCAPQLKIAKIAKTSFLGVQRRSRSSMLISA